MALKYVNAERGLELLEQGYELHGRGMKYCSYRFTKKPGSDTVDYWYRYRDSWDNGSWTVDEFLQNMGSDFGDTLMLCVWKDPDGNIVRESKSPAGRSRLDEARTPTRRLCRGMCPGTRADCSFRLSVCARCCRN